jgi:Putative addiction module component
MAMKSEELRREALALSEVERADLATELLVSLESPADEDPSVVLLLWGTEIERRARRVVAGDAESKDWTTVRQRLVDTLGR